MNARGTVYLVGAGPGDPGLITVRGFDLLRRADVIVHDRLIPHELLGQTKPGAELIDAGKSPACHSMAQDDINALLIEHARGGRLVVRLKGGDPFVFGRGFEELEACRAAGVECVVVPGVTSAVAAPAAAGIPLTARGMARSFAVVTAHVDPEQAGPPPDYAALAKLDTVVVLMGRAALREVAEAMMAAGKPTETPAACIQEATTAGQRTVLGTLATIADLADEARLAAPMVTVIGEVARFAETSKRRNVETSKEEATGNRQQATGGRARDEAGARPLLGRRVVVTRPLSTARETCALLRDLGATVIACPLVRIVYARHSERLDAALRRLADYDWLVVTSAHGVAAVQRRLRAIGSDAQARGRCRVAAVGSATAEALRRIGFEPQIVPETFTGAALVERMKRAAGRMGRVLYPRSAIASAQLGSALREAGAVVDDIVAYHTKHAAPPREALEAFRGGVDAVAFFSPSVVRRFASLDIDPGRAIIACVGTTTAAAAREAGLRVDVLAEPHTAEGLAAALVRRVGG